MNQRLPDKTLPRPNPELETILSTPTPRNKSIFPKILLISALLTLTIAGVFQIYFHPKSTSVPVATPSPQPTGKPIPSGKQVYRISRGKTAQGPNLKVVTIDPLDPKPGQTQTITATIENPLPLTLTNIDLQTDHQTTTYTLRRVKGTNTNGTWQTEITCNDSYDYIYYLKFDLHDSNSTFDGGLRIR